jgi:hypothetical protein
MGRFAKGPQDALKKFGETGRSHHNAHANA